MSAATKSIPVWLRSCSRCRTNGTLTKLNRNGALVCVNRTNCRRRSKRRDFLARRIMG